ncbi:MAG: DUF1294 domain-containing protein [Clostridia bacterium]|nr:DUF1294 domain-containing protein [Clostridia bacterium]
MQYLTIYYILINLLLFIFMGIDKINARFHKRRIKEATLLTLSLIGGGMGGFLSMFIFHHKIRKPYFIIVFAISIITHTILYSIIK